MQKVTFKEETYQLEGKALKVGDKAPDVKLVNGDLQEVSLLKQGVRFQVISALPSLTGSVCLLQAKHFNEQAGKLPSVSFSVISMDLPFSQGQICGAEGIKDLRILSDFRYKAFGENYGVLLGKGSMQGLLARSVFVLDDKGVVIYKEIVQNILEEPNYEALLKVLK
ncbi:thiol peroxidase [Helicobacter pylori]|uniref:thiol peroxidase n=1 Tax=Helicobacter pylori TaxID=210 RepID=UPI000958A36B|nr:thiol peroxidase [Helicobacter pylori]MCH4604671.1 thiol peroxidase [Helicobacter pylori]TPH69659.1 thiol peroxidase [Helicobacter pylori]UOR43945.1 thiol peroxidase [Helicobacter pylori]UOS09119.1 thiol peroxidase [Helicobacter pylori]UOS35960.1 thiol peroxidase [Helicobacter pylori]